MELRGEDGPEMFGLPRGRPVAPCDTEETTVTVLATCHCLSGGDQLTCDIHGVGNHPLCTCGKDDH